MKGLLVSVFRDASGVDCTNGGVSSKGADLVLIKNGAEIGPFSPESGEPVYLAKWCGRVIACPENLEVVAPRRSKPGSMFVSDRLGESSIEYLKGWMFGGNFVYSSDSRFAALVPGSYPIPVYDRREF